MPVSEVSPVFNPSCVLDIQHEEKRVMTTRNIDYLARHQILHDHPTILLILMMKKTMMPVRYLFNVEALNFFVNNEMNNSENVIDYFDENFVGTLLKDECLLVSM